MSTYEFWKFIHILLLVFWLGTDLGVLILARKFRDASLSTDTRVMLLQMAMVIDTLPRICFIVMLPVGFHLAAQLGLMEVPFAMHLGLWVLAALLLTVNVLAAKNMGTPKGQLFQRINWTALTIMGLALIGHGVGMLMGDAPNWLALKIMIYGAVYLFAIGIDWAFVPLGPAVAKLMESGSEPALESTISSSISRSLMFVHLVYVAVLAAAFLGVSKAL